MENFRPDRQDKSVHERMEAIAREAATGPLPESEMVRCNLFQALVNGEHVTQDRIQAGMWGFHALTRLLMPSETVADFIAERLETDPIPPGINMSDLARMVPTFHQLKGKRLKEGGAAHERAEYVSKFTQDEVHRFLAFCAACPDFALAVSHTQRYLGAYLERLRELVAHDNSAAADGLAVFQDHWAHASNFSKMIGPAVQRELSADVHPKAALDALDCKTMERAFDFLTESNAFEMRVAGWMMKAAPGISAPDLRFGCPAQPFLHELLVRNDTLPLVARSLRKPIGEHDLQAIVRELFLSQQRKVVTSFFQMAREILDRSADSFHTIFHKPADWS